MSALRLSDAPASGTFKLSTPTAKQEDQPVRALFHVTALADPNFLPRLIEPFAKLGLTPTRIYASCEDGDGSAFTVDLRLASVTSREAQLAEKMIRAIVGVRQVIVVTESAAG